MEPEEILKIQEEQFLEGGTAGALPERQKTKKRWFQTFLEEAKKALKTRRFALSLAILFLQAASFPAGFCFAYDDSLGFRKKILAVAGLYFFVIFLGVFAIRFRKGLALNRTKKSLGAVALLLGMTFGLFIIRLCLGI